MNSEAEYFIDERDCIACVHRDVRAHEDPCYGCIDTDENKSFEPDDMNKILDRMSEL
jgi:hypothetical protein